MNAQVKTIDDAWGRVRARLRTELGDATFNSWIKPVRLISANGDLVKLSAPTRFIRDWVDGNYGNRMVAHWTLEVESPCKLEIVVDQNNGVFSEEPAGRGLNQRPLSAIPSTLAMPNTAQTGQSASAASKVPSAPTLAQLAESMDREMTGGLDPRFTFDTFVMGKPNELALAASKRIAETDVVQFNPFYMYGGVGLGKTHLMHAMAWAIRERAPQRKVLYLSAEKFMYQFITALKNKDGLSFKALFRSVDVLMIDDVQFIANKDSTQEEFFHTFNALIEDGRQIVLTGDRSPTDLDGMEERLRSRLGWGLVADIHPTDYELRLSILQSKVELMGLKDQVPQKVVEFLAYRIVSNVRELEGALNRILAQATLVGRPITMDMVQDVLSDLIRANDRRLTIEDIKKRVAEHFNIKLVEFDSARRARAVARPRQVAMYLAKQLTSKSYPEIGRKFGGRDHTTVMHAVQKIQELLQADSGLAEDIDILRRQLRG